jgi:phosphatidylglycerophosphatase A
MERLARFVGTTFYSGYSTFAPGTVGSAVACLPLLVFPSFRHIDLLGVTVLIFFIGVWAATRIEIQTQKHDAGMINIDEVAGMFVSVLFLDRTGHWLWIGAAFFIFRLFDIVKPWPANVSQNLPRGWGVMTDDIIAGIYANLLLRVISLFI